MAGINYKLALMKDGGTLHWLSFIMAVHKGLKEVTPAPLLMSQNVRLYLDIKYHTQNT